MNVFKILKNKYLLLIPIVFLILNAFYFNYTTQEIQNTLVQQKLLAVTDAINMVATTCETGNNTTVLDHETHILDSMSFIDNLHLIYAAAFKLQDGNLRLISGRNYATDFDALNYPQFIEAAMTRERGNLIIGFTPQGQKYRDLHMYFRWMPHAAADDGRILVTAGVSEYSVITKISTWVSVGQWINMAVTFVLNIILITLILLGSSQKTEGPVQVDTGE